MCLGWFSDQTKITCIRTHDHKAHTWKIKHSWIQRGQTKALTCDDAHECVNDAYAHEMQVQYASLTPRVVQRGGLRLHLGVL
jgi:hypothetical protein